MEKGIGRRIWNSPWPSAAAGLVALLASSSASTTGGRIFEWVVSGACLLAFSVRGEERWGNNGKGK